MPPAERREYSGIAPPTTLAGGITNASTTIAITSGTGWPTGAVGPFFAVIDKGLPTEEKVKFSSRSTNTLTVATGGRGADGTAAASHSSGATIEHVVTAEDHALVNQHISDPTLDHHTQYMTHTEHVTEAHTNATLGYLGSFTGDFKPSALAADHGGAGAPYAWLLCDGREVSSTTYAALAAVLGTTFGTAAAGNVKLPDFRGRHPIGAGTGTGLTARTLGQSFGAETVTLAQAHMPLHNHTIAHTHSGTTNDQDRTHYHGIEGHQHYFNSPWAGDHRHNISGSSGPDIAFRAGGAANGLVGNPLERVTFTWMDTAGGHDHDGWTDGVGATTGWQPANTGHLHGFGTGGSSAANTGDVGSGTAVGIMNPSLGVNFFIKT